MANWFKVKRKFGGVGGPLEPGEFGLEDGTNQGLWIGATNPDGTTKQVLVNASSFQGIQKLGITNLNECDGVNNWYFCESDSVASTLENSPVEVAFTLHSLWIKNWGYVGLGVKLLQVLRTHEQEWERYAVRDADGVPVWNPWVLGGANGQADTVYSVNNQVADINGNVTIEAQHVPFRAEGFSSEDVLEAIIEASARATASIHTLDIIGWSSNQQTITVEGITATNIVLVAPIPAHQSGYTAANVVCVSQGIDSLTFQCATVPLIDIDVQVVIL